MFVLLLLLLAVTYVVYRIVFYAPNATQNDDHAVADTEQMRPYFAQIHRMIDELNARPYERVYITSVDGLRLTGRYYHQADGAPLDICFHGYRGTPSRDFSGGTRIYFDEGHNLLMVEERGQCGSEGHTMTFGVMERQDCLSWVQYAIGRFGPDVRIILNGISMGAATVLMAAELDLPANVRGIVADCPFTTPEAIIRKVCKEDMHLPPLLVMPFVRLAARLFGRFRLQDASAVSAVRHTRVPILLIHGEADHFVPWEMSLEILSANPAMIEFHSFPDAGHGISYLLDEPRYREIVTAFHKRCE